MKSETARGASELLLPFFTLSPDPFWHRALQRLVRLFRIKIDFRRRRVFSFEIRKPIRYQYGVGRFFSAAMAMAVAAIMSQATRVQASSTLGFADTGTPTVNTGNINTATVFNIGDLESTSAATGFFAGLPTQNFGAVTFNDTVGTSLSFTSGPFGTFTSTSITEIANVPGAVAFYVLGSYTGGSYDSEVSGGASFTITFNQTPPSSGGISDSATLSTPAAAVIPEPASLALGLTGMGALGIFCCFRKFAT